MNRHTHRHTYRHTHRHTCESPFPYSPVVCSDSAHPGLTVLTPPAEPFRQPTLRHVPLGMPVAVVNATVPRMLGYGSARLVGDNAHVADVPTAASAVMRTSHSSDDTHSCLFEVVSVCHAQHFMHSTCG